MDRGVIVQESIFRKGQEVFIPSELQIYRFQDKDEDAILECQRTTGARCIIIGTNSFSEQFFNSLKPGSLLVRFGVGYENTPIDLLKKRNLLAAYTPGTLDISVAEHTIALMLSYARRIIGACQGIKEGNWAVQPGTELRGKNLAILGLGKIGTETAKIAKNGFRMKISGFDLRKELPKEYEALVDFYSTDIDSVLAQADYVSLHMPVNKGTIGFINKEKLVMMKKDAILINTSRGKLVCEQDLYDALAEGEIAGAALDVFWNEPYTPVAGKDLRKLPNVLMAPHIASNTIEANRRMAEACIRNCIEYYRNELAKVTLIPELKGLFS